MESKARQFHLIQSYRFKPAELLAATAPTVGISTEQQGYKQTVDGAESHSWFHTPQSDLCLFSHHCWWFSSVTPASVVPGRDPDLEETSAGVNTERNTLIMFPVLELISSRVPSQLSGQCRPHHIRWGQLALMCLAERASQQGCILLTGSATARQPECSLLRLI